MITSADRDPQSSIALVFCQTNLAHIEQSIIDIRLYVFKSNKSKVAESLGIATKSLHNRLNKHHNDQNVDRRAITDVDDAIRLLCRSEIHESAPNNPNPLLSIQKCPLTFLFTQRSLDNIRQTITEHRLTKLDNNKTKTAKSLGIALKTLYNRLGRYQYSSPETRQFIGSVFQSVERLKALKTEQQSSVYPSIDLKSA